MLTASYLFFPPSKKASVTCFRGDVFWSSLPCSKYTSLPDLVGDAGIKFDATNFQDLSNKLVELFSDPNELMALSKLSLKKQKYSWLDVAEKAKNSIVTLFQMGRNV